MKFHITVTIISFIKKYREAFGSGLLLIAALVAEYAVDAPPAAYLSLYILSYLAVGLPVWQKAFRSMGRGNIFSEFLLMGIATVGAFAIGEYAEGVAVMLFYMIGEYVQHGAVHRARHSIKKLIDEQPDVAEVERDGRFRSVDPSDVSIGEVIRVKPGQKVPLDGDLLSERGAFNAAALTGESRPVYRQKGEEVWAGSINREQPVRIRVSREYNDTRLSNILGLVQEAARRKAPTQRFINWFAGIYTPIVVWLAVGLTFMPYFVVQDYIFQEWFYRALIFLVVSCPCGLVISVPLGYFGGIGAASRNGILLKGSDYLDQLRKMNILFMDKTGTLTEGAFEVRCVEPAEGYSRNELLGWAASLEQQSTHPIGRAIVDAVNGQSLKQVDGQQEISGRGLKGTVDGMPILVGNRALLESEAVSVPENGGGDKAATTVFVAVGGRYAGTIAIADRLKTDSRSAVQELRNAGVEKLIMLSGDSRELTASVAQQLELDEAYGGLMPDQKYEHVQQALNETSTVGFVGDGVNDAPVITLADVGIAMGGIGSDATIETADVVIQTDQPSKIATAVHIARFTHRIVWQNIGIALGIKGGVMALATMGYASMWAAIFADVGVALIAIANAVRVQQKYSSGSMWDFLRGVEKEAGSPSPSAGPEGKQPACCGCETC